MAIRSQSDGCACVHETGWLWPPRMAKRMHEWATSGAERRNTAAYGHAISLRFELSLGSVWARWARFPGARALGGSSTWRLGGLSGRQLTGPVAEAPGPGSGFALERRIAPPSRARGLMPDAQAGLMRIPASLSHKCPYEKLSQKKLDLDRGCAFSAPPARRGRGGCSFGAFSDDDELIVRASAVLKSQGPENWSRGRPGDLWGFFGGSSSSIAQ